MKALLLAILLPLTAEAWTLNNNFGASFKDNRVKVFVDGATVCPFNNLTTNELESLIPPALDEFWNTVPTSNLKLEAAGFSDPIFTMNHGRLCSPTDQTCITQGTTAGSDGTPADGLIPAVDEIIIACNDNQLNFGADNVLAVTIPNNFSGKKITGAVILIQDSNDGKEFGKLSKEDKVAVIAHEIGHAIGLGHSKEQSALMFYRTVNLRQKLGQDDIDGVSFLYPIKGDVFGLVENGLLGSCGTIGGDENDPPGPSVFLTAASGMILLILLFELRRRLYKS